MSGKPIVIGLLVLGIVIAAAAIAYQSHVRPRIAGDLADEVKRPRAFADLLRMNRLTGHARKWSHDPAAGGGKAYLRFRPNSGAVAWYGRGSRSRSVCSEGVEAILEAASDSQEQISTGVGGRVMLGDVNCPSGMA
ncbi:MAG TPA: hypothetical protein VMT52_03390 [Planctomycetota bacterium]|nr:hypothetical protein [Planctomycetota bacterium]